MEDKPEVESRRWLKFPGRFRKNVRPPQGHKPDEVDSDDDKRNSSERDDELEETSGTLSLQEEELLSRGRPSEEDVDRLWRDLEVLKLRVLTAVQQSLTCDDGGLASAMAAVRQQEALDRRWAGGAGPPWRPLKCLSAHNALLADVVESRLEEAARDADGVGGLSTAVKRRVCGMGKRVKADLLRCVRVLQPSYGPDVDVLNIYAALCQRSLSARLSRMIRGGLQADECAYLLFWVNTFYPQEILQHEELRGKLKTGCLGALLQRDQVRQLEERFMNSKEEQLSLWLHKVLQREEDQCSGANMPEVMDDYFFSPLAIDVIQVIDGSLADLSCLLGEDGTKSHKVTAHLESFLLRYKKTLEKLAQRNDERASAWMKAHLACQEQLGDYVRSQSGSQAGSQLVSETGSQPASQAGSQAGCPSRGRMCCHRCEAILDRLREFAFSTLTRPIHGQLKVYYRQLWTAGWFEDSQPLMVSLLDSLFDLFSLQLTGLKASCRQSLVRTFQRELVSEYMRRMSKGRLKSGERAGAAERMLADADKMDDFFHAVAGCGERSRFGPMLRHLADALRLHRPASVRQEMVAFARKFPDFSEPALSALLALKSDVSAADARSIRRGVEEELASTNQRPALFSKRKGGEGLRTAATLD